jgi:hypothetical protein
MGPNTASGHLYGDGWLDRFAYLLRLWGQPFPEAWAVHLHGLHHGNRYGDYIWDNFDRWWSGFLSWMRKARVERPVFITELSAGRYWPAVHEALMKHAAMRAADMSPQWSLFQGFFWFSTRGNDPRFLGNLLDHQDYPTNLGRTFKGL